MPFSDFVPEAVEPTSAQVSEITRRLLADAQQAAGVGQPFPGVGDLPTASHPFVAHLAQAGSPAIHLPARSTMGNPFVGQPQLPAAGAVPSLPHVLSEARTASSRGPSPAGIPTGITPPLPAVMSPGMFGAIPGGLSPVQLPAFPSIPPEVPEEMRHPVSPGEIRLPGPETLAAISTPAAQLATGPQAFATPGASPAQVDRTVVERAAVGVSPGPADQQPRYEGLTAFVQRMRLTGCETRPAGVVGLPGPHPFESLSGELSRLASSGSLDVAAVRRDFPILQQRVHGQPLAWLDNAATTQKPQVVIDALRHFYETENSNIHRGAHTLAAKATEAYERARETVRRFVGAESAEEIVFVRGTTEGINLVAQTFGHRFLRPGDEILLSVLEHHANIVPWQMVARQTGAHIRSIPVNDRGEILLGEYERLLGPRTRLVGLTHASNSLGTVLPIAEMTALAHRHGARVLIDGAQTIAHLPVDVRRDQFDFFVFSGHKVFGPTGIGAVYARRELWAELPPWQGGGNMIREVSFEETTFADPPARFEAGTPNVADAVGLGVALDYVTRLGLPLIARHEHDLLEYATHQLQRIPGVRLIGTAREKVGVLSFLMDGRRPEDVGRFLDQRGIAVRAGHHCAQPSLRRFGLTATVRPSFSIYNTRDEVDRLAAAVRELTGR